MPPTLRACCDAVRIGSTALTQHARWILAGALVVVEVGAWLAVVNLDADATWPLVFAMLAAPIAAFACGAIAGLLRGLTVTAALWFAVFLVVGVFASDSCTFDDVARALVADLGCADGRNNSWGAAGWNLLIGGALMIPTAVGGIVAAVKRRAAARSAHAS